MVTTHPARREWDSQSTVGTTRTSEAPARQEQPPEIEPATTAPAFTFDVAIVGLGYVGLPTALSYHEAGQRVLGLDADPGRLAAIRAGFVDVVPSDAERLHVAVDDIDGFSLSIDPQDMGRAAAVIICVPTPIDDHLVPDLTILRAACASAVAAAVPGQLLMLTSTTYVGCTEDLLVAPLAARGLVAGVDVHVAFSAERIDPGSDRIEQTEIARVVGGATPACERVAATVLSRYARHVHCVRSVGTAEMTKLLENTFRAVNIALINEFADICRTLDLDVSEVIGAAATKPYGFMAFRPGPGVGGHCIPCDPHYLLWQLRGTRTDAPLVTEAMRQIAARPHSVVDRIRGLHADAGIAMSDSRVLVVGISYKPDVADVRESPALRILDELMTAGAEIAYVDSHVHRAVLASGIEIESTQRPAEFDPTLVLLHTSHRNQDLAWVAEGQLVLDTTYQAPAGTTSVTL